MSNISIRKLLISIPATLLLGALCACSPVAAKGPSPSVSITVLPVMSASAQTTKPPGVRTIDEIADRFEELISANEAPPTCARMPEGDLEWLFEETVPVSVTAARGFELGGSDLIILFLMEPSRTEDSKLASEIESVARKYLSRDDEQLFVYASGDFGFIGKSGDGLWETAIAARQT